MNVDWSAIAGRAPATVLNVNDHEQNRYLVSKMLRNAGFQVLEAVAGLEAVELARQHRPEVIVLDIRLPDIDGMEVCRRIKADPETASPLVLHTSATFAGIDIKIRGLDIGGDAFLAQPFTSQELIATVKALVRIKRIEEFQRRRAEEFAEADRRKDEFLAMLAHELRNPLNALTVAHALMDRYDPRDDGEKRARSAAQRQVEQLTRIVNDLLDVSRVSRGKVRLECDLLDIGALLRQVAASVQDATCATRRQRITASLPPYPVAVDGDRARLEQVFTNLLDNASKYSPDGTEIEVELDVEAAQAGRVDAVVTIVDHGRGIAEEQLNQVFKLFYQAQPTEARQGTGLGIGLTLVRSLIELHGGSVAVSSEGDGRGSQFEVRLPARQDVDLAAAAAADNRPTLARRRRMARRGRTILLVEDNPDARELLASLCDAWGYQVELARDGFEGLEKILRLTPEVALVDIGLPGIDGYEIARRVRTDSAASPVKLVALTGYGLPEQRQKAIAAGFDLHLVKPVDVEVLAALLADPSQTIVKLGGNEQVRREDAATPSS